MKLRIAAGDDVKCFNLLESDDEILIEDDGGYTILALVPTDEGIVARLYSGLDENYKCTPEGEIIVEIEDGMSGEWVPINADALKPKPKRKGA